jgi:hypothetical protein
MATSADKHRGTKKFIERCCTNLTVAEVDWENASDPKRYNCFGFAVGVLRWWQYHEKDRFGKIKNPRDHWPGVLPNNDSIEAYTKAAENEGFVCCEPGWEPGFEKIVLFYTISERKFTHAARHISPDRWKSKIGPESDIEHPESIGCEWYGDGRVYMKRSRLMPTSGSLSRPDGATTGNQSG